MKKISGILVAICLILMAVGCSTNTSVLDAAASLIQEDLGIDIVVESVYYNKEQEGCVVAFNSKGVGDIACIHLDTKEIGYESVSENLHGSALISYPYDSIWVYNVKMNGSSKGWEKLK